MAMRPSWANRTRAEGQLFLDCWVCGLGMLIRVIFVAPPGGGSSAIYVCYFWTSLAVASTYTTRWVMEGWGELLHSHSA